MYNLCKIIVDIEHQLCWRFSETIGLLRRIYIQFHVALYNPGAIYSLWIDIFFLPKLYLKIPFDRRFIPACLSNYWLVIGATLKYFRCDMNVCCMGLLCDITAKQALIYWANDTMNSKPVGLLLCLVSRSYTGIELHNYLHYVRDDLCDEYD